MMRELITWVMITLVILFFVGSCRQAQAAAPKVTEISRVDLGEGTSMIFLCVDGIQWLLTEKVWGSAPAISLQPQVAMNGAFLRCRN